MTVAYETTAGTATLGGDVTRVGGTVTFASGSASGTVLNITVPLLPDTTNEPLETFTVLLSTATRAALTSPAGPTITIADDDLGPAMAGEARTAGATLKTPFTVSVWAIDESSRPWHGDRSHSRRCDAERRQPRCWGWPPSAWRGRTSRCSKTTAASRTWGVYRIVAQALSTVTGTVNQFREITVTVTANPSMWTEQPGAGTTVNQSFTISGWAIERAAASGTGINTVHIWAYPNPGFGTGADLGGDADLRHAAVRRGGDRRASVPHGITCHADVRERSQDGRIRDRA